jgi:hypothetical protein
VRGARLLGMLLRWQFLSNYGRVKLQLKKSYLSRPIKRINKDSIHCLMRELLKILN